MGTYNKRTVVNYYYRWCSVLFIVYIVISCVLGIVIEDNVVYSSAGSPYVITDDIVIEKRGHLKLDPGITLKFDPGVGITVKGVLTAQGTEEQQITLTSSNPPQDGGSNPLLRLVDGPAPTRGRLQMFYKDKWRSICTNSKNWTEPDRQVACRELGFSGGSFYEWQDRANNDTATLLFEAPACAGREAELTQCDWLSHAMGGGVCDLHPDLGLACEETHALWKGTHHWRGILFWDAEHTQERIWGGALFEKVSRSLLQHVRVEYAGMGPGREVLGAVRGYRTPPRMSDVIVHRNAYTGINFTLPDTFVTVARSRITHNGGIGIYVNTSLGALSVLDGTVVSDNFGTGIKYHLHHREPDLRNSEQFLDFCSGATNPGQSYPQVVVARQNRYSYQEERCKRKFFTSTPGLVLTVHFMYAQVDKDDSSTIEVRDRDQYGVLLSKFPVRNNTVAPSVVSLSNSIYVTFKADPGKQVVAYMQVLAHKFKIPDIVVDGSVSERNSGHGVSVENMRSLVLVHKSNLTDNIFGSGLNVRGGAGDVNVTYSAVTNNIGDGVNVTYEGGLQNVTYSTVANNVGRGVAFWFNETGHDTRMHQETGVAHSTFYRNLDVGLLVGNFCREAVVNVSTNVFLEGVREAVRVESCWRPEGEVRTVLIGHNTFRRNNRLALAISPAVQMNFTIHWNEFHENRKGTLKLFNEDINELEVLPLTGTVAENTFTDNSGIYVMQLTLNLRAIDQHLLVTRNTIKDNVIQEAYSSIASRSKSSGVVCIGSFNVELYRNLIENRKSLYELSSHALDQSSPINASFNWLGTKDEERVFDRVFDRRDRYTLAVIEFHPFLLSDNNIDTPLVTSPQYSEPDFFHPDDETRIGGEVNGNIVLTESFYTVVRDIYVQHTGVFTIPFGTTLEFAESVGIMVTGILRTEGSGDKKVRFTVAGTTEREKIKALVEAGHIDELPENMTSSNKTVDDGPDFAGEENVTETGPEIPVQLTGGRDETEGRLMVYWSGAWGSVCEHGFNEDAAAVACQQMGFVLNPDDWLLDPAQVPDTGPDNRRILRSNVQCDEFDTDFVSCVSDLPGDLENSCQVPVGLRCYRRTWAGIRLGMSARESHMKGVVIEKAGLLDYTRREFKPALQVDLNQHVLQDLTVQENSEDGIGIIRNNVFAIANPEARNIRGCHSRGNRRHGINFAQLGANITGSRFSDNRGSGIHFDPFISRGRQRELTGWMNLRHREFERVPGLGDGASVTLTKGLHRVFATQNLRGKAEVQVTFHVKTDHSNVIGIQVLNPIEPSSTEQVVIYDYPTLQHDKDVSRWSLRRDLSVFPTTSSSYAITIQYESGPFAMGDAIFVLTAVDKRDIAFQNDLRHFRPKVPSLFVEETQIYRNNIGLSTRHYDRFLTDDHDHLLRNSNETIAIVRSLIVDNRRQGVYTLSPFRAALDNDRVGEVTLMFNDSTISRNGRGVEQFSWDLRESNNLFHWSFENVSLEDNGGGGLSLSLPYVWQYNENFTHSVYVNHSRFTGNADFEFTITGHFARVNISRSRFDRNVCSKGVLSLKGMEKEVFIRENVIEGNVGHYMVEFRADSQSEIMGNVLAYFTGNRVQGNRHPPQARNKGTHLPASAAVAVRGVQRINITYNLFGDNEMDYELFAGLYTAQLGDRLNVRANWWGSREVPFIRERIFDFDDWNNYALALFRPFLVEPRFNAPVGHSIGAGNDDSYVQDDSLGGRLTEDLLLKKRDMPYIVKSDLTVMPGVILGIEPGVVMEFFPSVGILVLGKLEAIGRREDRIVMRPVNLREQTQHYRVGRQAGGTPPPPGYSSHYSSTSTSTVPDIDVRLCVEGQCGDRSSGFVDLFNATTRQWVPLCDVRFSERNAQVACRQLGFNRVNVFVGRDIRTEMYPNALTRVRAWPQPIQCQGTENRLSECPIRMTGQIYSRSYDCPWNGDFVFLSCGDLNLPPEDYEYWGGIRFSIPDFEFSNLFDRIHATNTPHDHNHHHNHNQKVANPSILAWLDVMGAGLLHNEKTPAILSFYETPTLLDVSVTHSAYDGVTLISPHQSFEMLHNRFENNLGVGVSLLGLTGETRETSESSFTPVGTGIRLPYGVFGLVEACDPGKELVVEERVLLYFKYDNAPVDCVKIFKSAFDVKKFGFRLLQFNLFNSSSLSPLSGPPDPSPPDRLILYDGDIYNETTVTIATLTANSPMKTRFFKTKGTRLSLQLHTSGASGVHGFVAEIVTLPVSTIGLDRDLLHNLTYNQFYDNQEGAFYGVTAGEVNPWLALTWSRFERNGLSLYGNITTTHAAVSLDLQNMRTLYFKNNLVRNNTGGLSILAGSNGAATKLVANITNNLFSLTRDRPSLYVESKPRSAYQEAFIAYNDFSRANVSYHDVITLAQIVSDFSYNYVHSNLGRHILDIYGFEKVRLPVYQTTAHNSFAKNRAVDPAYPGTVVAGSAGQQYVDNVFYNLDNAYEMVAVNETMSGLRSRCNISTECRESIKTFKEFHRYLDMYRSDVWKTPVDARGNWWGFNTSVAVSGRVHDKLDDDRLLKVNYNEWKLDNRTLLQGCEPGYSLVSGSCLLYVGAPVTFAEAKDFCRGDNASMPFLQTGFHQIRMWLHRQQPEYHWDTDMVWVAHYDFLAGGACAAFVDYRVRSVDCQLNLPFICESDSDEIINASAWVSDSLVIGAVTATFGCLLLVAACVACWICKSRARMRERIIRRNSIRASIRSNRSAMSSTSGGFSDVGQRRRIIQEPNTTHPTKGNRNGAASGAEMGVLPPPLMGGGGATSNGGMGGRGGLNESFNSIAKSNLNYSEEEEDPSYVVYETTHGGAGPPQGGHFPHNDIDARFAHDPDLENENVNMMVRPSFDLAYQNRAFRDTSTFASTDTASGAGFDSREPSNNGWCGSTSNLQGSSFRDRSVGGSTTHLGVSLHPHPPMGADIHTAATLPRNTAPEVKFRTLDHPPPLRAFPLHPPDDGGVYTGGEGGSGAPGGEGDTRVPSSYHSSNTLRQEDFSPDTTDTSAEGTLNRELSLSQPLETAM